MPSAWRSARSSSSYSAAAARTANLNRPSLVSRSKLSVSDFTLTPRSRSSPMVVRTCAAERPHRSDFQNTSVSPGCRADRAAVNPGRCTPRLPDSVSANSRSYPWVSRASSWSCGFWSRDDTRQ